MGSFVCRQPNGLLCRFSTVVDTVTHYNMTDEEYIQMKVATAREEAEDVIKNHLKPFDWIDQYFVDNNKVESEYYNIGGFASASVIKSEGHEGSAFMFFSYKWLSYVIYILAAMIPLLLFVTEKAWNNPKFVEDVLRDCVVALRKHPLIKEFEVDCEAFKSIHNHSAWAYQKEVK